MVWNKPFLTAALSQAHIEGTAQKIVGILYPKIQITTVNVDIAEHLKRLLDLYLPSILKERIRHTCMEMTRGYRGDAFDKQLNSMTPYAVSLLRPTCLTWYAHLICKNWTLNAKLTLKYLHFRLKPKFSLTFPKETAELNASSCSSIGTDEYL